MSVIRRLANGHLVIPRRAEGPDGIIGDGVQEIDESHPHWARWLASFERAETRKSESTVVQAGRQPDGEAVDQ